MPMDQDDNRGFIECLVILKDKDLSDDDRFIECLGILKDNNLSEVGEDSINEFLEIFEKLYFDDNGEQKFRHRYSDILKVVSEFPLEANATDDSFITLLNNMKELIKKSNNKKLTDVLNKLDDHIQLEAFRYEKLRESNRDSLAMQKRLVRSNNHLGEKIKKTEEKMELECENYQKSLKAAQSQFIGVIGIFAGLLMAFSGSISFGVAGAEIAAGLQSINSLLFLVSLVALALIQAIAVLFAFVWAFVKEDKKIPTLVKSTYRNATIIFVAITVVLFISLIVS